MQSTHATFGNANRKIVDACTPSACSDIQGTPIFLAIWFRSLDFAWSQDAGLTIVIPSIMLAGFAFANIPMLDSHLHDHYGAAFDEYEARTSKLIPFVYWGHRMEIRMYGVFNGQHT